MLKLNLQTAKKIKSVKVLKSSSDIDSLVDTIYDIIKGDVKISVKNAPEIIIKIMKYVELLNTEGIVKKELVIKIFNKLVNEVNDNPSEYSSLSTILPTLIDLIVEVSKSGLVQTAITSCLICI